MTKKNVLRKKNKFGFERLFIYFPIVVCFSLYLTAVSSFAENVSFTDARGIRITIEQKPSRIVSVVPSVTEIIFAIGAGDSVSGVTYHDTFPPEINQKTIVGGFSSPSIEIIEKIKPDIIFISDIHNEIIKTFGGHPNCRVINLETKSVNELYDHINLLGKIFQTESEATKLIKKIKADFDTLALKIAKIQDKEKKRILRSLGNDRILVPGDDSFQNEYIRLAGGIAPKFGKNGKIIEITTQELNNFNPQIIYTCGDYDITKLSNDPKWQNVEAVKNNQIHNFPCELTCRLSTHAAYFVSWMASLTYKEMFSKKENQVLQDQIFESVPLTIPLDYIKNANVVYSHIQDFTTKTLVIDFKTPQKIVSTLDGELIGIESVGNHYYPPQTWYLGHSDSIEQLKNQLFGVIGKNSQKACFLFTGADMDNLVVTNKKFKQMEVFALVTAGVQSNAVRMSQDYGNYYEPGTINIIILTNMQLTSRAMTGAIISATEAKTAALSDMDIRSSYTPLQNQATGTGTDNIIIVQGSGFKIDNVGGHTKMGELIARSVYESVRQAILKQNSLISKRSMFKRLQERKINICALSGELCKQMEKIILDRSYSGFLESTLAISDQYEKGLISDISQFEQWSSKISQQIAAPNKIDFKEYISDEQIPLILKIALNDILNGVFAKNK